MKKATNTTYKKKIKNKKKERKNGKHMKFQLSALYTIQSRVYTLHHSAYTINPKQVTLVTRISSQMILVTFITAPYFKIRSHRVQSRRSEIRIGVEDKGKEGEGDGVGVCCSFCCVCCDAVMLPLSMSDPLRGKQPNRFALLRQKYTDRKMGSTNQEELTKKIF